MTFEIHCTFISTLKKENQLNIPQFWRKILFPFLKLVPMLVMYKIRFISDGYSKLEYFQVCIILFRINNFVVLVIGWGYMWSVSTVQCASPWNNPKLLWRVIFWKVMNTQFRKRRQWSMLVEQLLSRQNFLSWHDGVKFINFSRCH